MRMDVFDSLDAEICLFPDGDAQQVCGLDIEVATPMSDRPCRCDGIPRQLFPVNQEVLHHIQTRLQ